MAGDCVEAHGGRVRNGTSGSCGLPYWPCPQPITGGGDGAASLSLQGRASRTGPVCLGRQGQGRMGWTQVVAGHAGNERKAPFPALPPAPCPTTGPRRNRALGQEQGVESLRCPGCGGHWAAVDCGGLWTVDGGLSSCAQCHCPPCLVPTGGRSAGLLWPGLAWFCLLLSAPASGLCSANLLLACFWPACLPVCPSAWFVRSFSSHSFQGALLSSTLAHLSHFDLTSPPHLHCVSSQPIPQHTFWSSLRLHADIFLLPAAHATTRTKTISISISINNLPPAARHSASSPPLRRAFAEHHSPPSVLHIAIPTTSTHGSGPVSSSQRA